MSLFTKTANDTFAPYGSDGVARAIAPQEAQVWGTEVERLITAFQAGGGIIFPDKATMDAALTYAPNQQAWVMGDATVGNNGVYRKIGISGSGSWVRLGDLPYSFIVASDAGAGTPNAIQATTSIPVSSSALIWMNVLEANTASPVTVAFNGGAVLTIKTNSGNDVEAGGLTAGTIVLGIVSGSTFRLVSDQASAAVVAAAEAAAAAALSAVPNAFPPLRSTMAGYNTATVTSAMLKEGGREGQFFWDGSNLSAKVTADTEQIGFVAPASDPTGANGAWRRNLKLSRLYPEMAGVIGDDTDRVGAYLKMQQVLDFAAREKAVLHLAAGGLYRIDGPMVTSTGLWIEKDPGAILRLTEWSIYVGGAGGLFSNVYNIADPDSMAQSDIRFDLEIDGSLIPAATFGFAVAATSTTITLPADFDGKVRAGKSRLTVVVGTGSSQSRFVTAWDPVTRIATVQTAWTTIPDTTSFVGEGGNDNAVGFARGAHDVVGRVRAYDFPATWLLAGSGGKALNLERGCRNFDVTVEAERCGWAAFVQGVAGTYPGYSPENQAAGNNRQWARDIRLDVYAKDCECALGVYGITSDSDPSGNGNDGFLWAKVQARNCGHATSRPLGSNRDVKSGVVVLAEAENFNIILDSVTDADFAPVWPDASPPGAPFVGAGLSGGIGAVVQGWGRNGKVVARHTDSGVQTVPTPLRCDSLYNMDRARAMGDDAGPTAIPQNVYDLDIEITHVGAQPANGLVWQKGTIGNVDAAEITMNLKFITNYAPTTVIGNSFSYSNANVEVISRPSGNQRQRGVVGSAARIRSELNTLVAAADFHDLRGFTIGAGPAINTMTVLTATAVHDVGTVAANTETSFTVAVPGATVGTKVYVEAIYNGARITGVVIEAAVTAADVVTVYFFNATASSKTPGSRTWSVMVTSII